MRDGVADSDRAQIVIEAMLCVSPGRDATMSGGRDRNWRSQYHAQTSALYINRAVNPDIDIRDGDRVRALARPGEPVFVVASVDDRSAHRLVVNLGEG